MNNTYDYIESNALEIIFQSLVGRKARRFALTENGSFFAGKTGKNKFYITLSQDPDFSIKEEPKIYFIRVDENRFVFSKLVEYGSDTPKYIDKDITDEEMHEVMVYLNLWEHYLYNGYYIFLNEYEENIDTGKMSKIDSILNSPNELANSVVKLWKNYTEAQNIDSIESEILEVIFQSTSDSSKLKLNDVRLSNFVCEKIDKNKFSIKYGNGAWASSRKHNKLSANFTFERIQGGKFSLLKYEPATCNDHFFDGNDSKLVNQYNSLRELNKMENELIKGDNYFKCFHKKTHVSKLVFE